MSELDHKAALVGISGAAGGGKSTIAMLLAKHLGDVDVRPLAEPLKFVCRDILGIPERLLYGSDADKQTLTDIRQRDMPHWVGGPASYRDEAFGAKFLTVREVLQQMGTEVFRKMRPRCWIDSMLWHRKACTAAWMFVDDVRFIDEADAIRAAGGRVVRLLRSSGSSDTHSSETALDAYAGFDLVVDNRDESATVTASFVLSALEGWFPMATDKGVQR